jgi:hypothetical protein
MREISKPSTAQCNYSLYTLFLMAEPRYVSCVRLAEILEDISHDSVNRFLLRERYTPEDLFNELRRLGKAKRAHLDEISSDGHGLALCPSYVYSNST